MVTPELLRAKAAQGLAFSAYVDTATPDQVSSWRASRHRVELTDDQRSLIAAWTRELQVLAISGTWCGDCVHQVPMLDAIAQANPRLKLRILNRDAHLDLADHVKISSGHRVPTVLFANEDFDFLSLYGDKSLSRLRATAAKALGAACAVPSALMPADEAKATLQDWIDEFERAQLIARLSTKLRQRHGD